MQILGSAGNSRKMAFVVNPDCFIVVSAYMSTIVSSKTFIIQSQYVDTSNIFFWYNTFLHILIGIMEKMVSDYVINLTRIAGNKF